MEELLLGLVGYLLGIASVVAYRHRPRKPHRGDPDAALRLYQQMKEQRDA